MDLVAMAEIRQVKHRYLRFVDMKRWDDLEDTLTPEAVAVYGTQVLGEPLTLEGRDAIVTFLRENLGEGLTSAHIVSEPELEVDGDTAVGWWPFEDTILVPEHRLVVKGAAIYEDQYQRGEDDRWRIARTSHVRTYEYMLSLDDVPSLRFTSNMWAPAGSGS